ncbi:MAG: hypothetical protein AB7V50_09545 [Vampirovibrionia bacterium]
MSIIYALFVVILLFGGFTIIVIGVWYLMMKLQHKMSENPLIKKVNAKKMYCNECNKAFFNYESIKTKVGIYPCPYCAGKQTTGYDEIKNDEQ